jgi:hypothetical protein
MNQSSLTTISVPFNFVNQLASQLRKAGAKFNVVLQGETCYITFRILTDTAQCILHSFLSQINQEIQRSSEEITPEENQPQVEPISEEITEENQPQVEPISEEITEESQPQVEPISEEITEESQPQVEPISQGIIQEESQPQVEPISEEITEENQPQIEPISQGIIQEESQPQFESISEAITQETQEITENQEQLATFDQLILLEKKTLKALARNVNLVGRSKMTVETLAEALIGKIPVSAL